MLGKKYIEAGSDVGYSMQNETIEKLPFKRYHIYAFANPRSGDGLA